MTTADSDQRGEGTWHALTGLGVAVCYCTDGQHRRQHMFATPSTEMRDGIIADHTVVSTLREQLAEARKLLQQTRHILPHAHVTWQEVDAFLTALDEAHTPQARDEETK